MQWYFLSFITAVMFSISYALSSYVDKNNDVNNVAWTTSIHLIGVVLILLLIPFNLPHSIASNVMPQTLSILTDPWTLAITAALGLCMFTSEVCLYNSLNMAPNPGLPTTVNNFYIVVFVLMAYLFYDLPINKRQLGGIALLLFSLHLVSG